MKRIITLVSTVFLLTGAFAQNPTIRQEDRDRAAALVKQMTLEEKCNLIVGQRESFYTYEIERLGVPSVLMADGPQGVRKLGNTYTNSTYYPCGLAIAASWNRSVAKGVGEGIGYDAKARGVGIMLCPGVNIYRSALCGRNFEYMGEDPYLASETACNYINGIQEQGVMATIKHFALNQQEYARHWVSSEIDERTLNEIYFPTFKKAVEKADVACVMTSYNLVNGTHAAESAYLIKDNLRAWGFDGIVMSDWVSTYTTLGCVSSGLDMEMPRAYAFTIENIQPLLDNGVISMKDIDDKCQHILQSYIAYGFLDNNMKDSSIPEDYAVSRALAYQAAVEAPVLLKNNGVLPITGGSVVLAGPNADCIPYGGGSGAMYPFEHRMITLYQGLKNTKTFDVNLRQSIYGDASVKGSDTIILAVGFDHDTEKENSDRTYALPKGQDELIAKAIATGKKVVVVVYSGGEVDMTKWIDKVDAVIMAWYTGQEGGQALADIICGKVSPSGRLPFTFWGTLAKNPATPYYQSRELVNRNSAKYHERYSHYKFTEYTEGLFFGYRAIDKNGIEPLYPFGFGLTYSEFDYTDPKLVELGDNKFEVVFDIKNIGGMNASEVAQLYVSPVNPSVARPHHELKGYTKVNLAKGQKTTVRIALDESAFAYYDKDSHSWKVDAGDYVIMVGASATDIKFQLDVDIK